MARRQTSAALAADKVGEVKAAAIAALPQQGVLYHGLEVMGGGSILAGLVLGAIGVFVIERDFVEGLGLRARRRRADLFRLHAWRGGRHRRRFGVTPAVALAYAVVAGGLFALGRLGAGAHYVSHPEMPAAPAE